MNGHIPDRHCTKNKISPRVNYMFLRLLINARRGNARWLVSCSFQWRAHDGGCRLEDKSDARERAGVSPGCRWILEWKSGSAEGRKKMKERKKESESETVFDCVAFSLSRLFRNEYRQWPTQRRFFSSRLERGRVPFHLRSLPSSSSAAFPHPPPPLLSLVRSHLSVVIERNWNEVTECQYYVIGSCVSLFPTEFRCRLILTPNRKISRIDSAKPKSGLNEITSRASSCFFFISLRNKGSIVDFFFNLSKLDAHVHRSRGLAHIQKCWFQLDLASRLVPIFFSSDSYLAAVGLRYFAAINPFQFLYAAETRTRGAYS